MTKTEYGQYLQSSHWKKMRVETIEGAENKCEQCGIPRWLAEIAYDQDLHVHHISYGNIGDEQYGDLEVLCRRCHDIETFGRSDLRKVPETKCEICGEKHWNRRSPFCSVCSGLMDECPILLHDIVSYVDPKTRSPIWEGLLGHIMYGVAAKSTDEAADIIIQRVEQFRERSRVWAAQMQGVENDLEVPF